MKDPVKLTHSHVEIQNMLDELESVHFPSQEFQNMVDLFEAADKKRNEPKEDMDVSALQEYYAALEDSYDKLQKAARAYIDKKDRSSKGIEKNRTPEEEKRYRTAKAIAKYADEMGESSWYYRNEFRGIEQVTAYKKDLEKSKMLFTQGKEMIDLCKLALKLKTIKEDTDRYTLSNALEGISYHDRKTGYTAIIPDRCNPEKPETLANISSGMKRLLDGVELKNDPDSAQWVAEKIGQEVRPFSDLSDIAKHLQDAYKGVSGKGIDSLRNKEQGHLYFKAVKNAYYDNDMELRRCLADKIGLHNQLAEMTGNPENGLTKIQMPNIESETFYDELRDAISQKENGEFKHTQKGRRAFLPGTEALGALTTQMYRFREAVKEVEKQKAVVEEHNTIQKSRQDQFVRPHVIETVEYMKKNPIGKQNDAELDACLKQIDSNLSTVNRTLQDCETGSPIYAYAQDRALEPLKDYMVSAVKRYNQMHEDTPIRLPSERENTRSFFTLLKKNASIMDPGGQIEAVAEKALKISSVELNERGKQYEAHAKQQREYKKLASQFKNEVDKSMFPSPAYKKMAELFKKAASAEAEPDPVKRANAYQALYNAAGDYLIYKDPALNGKPNKKLSEYEEKRVKFAEDLREFCRNGGASPERYDVKKENCITNRQPYQPVKGGPNLG